MSKPLRLTREQWEAIDYADFAQEARNRGVALVPAQYVTLLMKIAETNFWPALYDADGNYIGEQKETNHEQVD